MLIFSNFRVFVKPDIWMVKIIEKDHLRWGSEVPEFIV